jgi:hypothetical protein
MSNTKLRDILKPLPSLAAALLIGSLGGCASSAPPVPPASPPASVQPALQPAALEARLAQGPAVVSVPAARMLSFYGMRAVAQRDSTVYLNVNADGVALAVLFGRVHFVGHTVRAGELCFWSRTASDVQVAEFDAANFLSEHERPLDEQVIVSLEEAAARQAHALWWGAVEREPLQF